MEVTYSTTRSDQWRCNLYVMFHRRSSVMALLAPPTCLAIWLAWGWASLGWWGAPAAFAAAFGGWALLNALLLWLLILRRLPTRETKRICTTLIAPDFFRDVVPEKIMQYAWTQITEIRLHGGDFYFWLGDNRGNFIPRGAFGNPRQGQLFYETALAYWHSAKSGRPVTLPQEGEVWPPPPSLG